MTPELSLTVPTPLSVQLLRQPENCFGKMSTSSLPVILLAQLSDFVCLSFSPPQILTVQLGTRDFTHNIRPMLTL